MSDIEPQAQDTGKREASPLLRHILPLVAVALLAAVLLSLLQSATAERATAARRAAERAALEAVLPPTQHDNDLLTDSFVLDPAAPQFTQQELLGLSAPRTAYLARSNGTPSAVILPLETRGYRGPILLLIGIDREGAITGVRAVEHNETPGLGDKIDLDESRWILGFDRRSLDNTDPVLWRVKKDGGEFDQFVGATQTPRAVVGVVRQALDFFELNRAALLGD